MAGGVLHTFASSDFRSAQGATLPSNMPDSLCKGELIRGLDMNIAAVCEGELISEVDGDDPTVRDEQVFNMVVETLPAVCEANLAADCFCTVAAVVLHCNAGSS